jgi:hypothetical protein
MPMKLKLSKNPEKAKIGMTDVRCLVGGHTLFIDDTNPCRNCANLYTKEIPIDVILDSMY